MTRLHPFARLCLAALGLFVAQLVAGLGLAAVFIGVKMAQSPGQPLEKIIGQVASASETNALLITLFVYPIGVLWLGFCRAKLDKRSFISLGVRRSRIGFNLLRGALAGLLSIAVIWAILWLTGTIAVGGWSEAARGPNVVFALLGWAIAFAAVGFFEELLFRGYALHNLTNWLGWRGAVVVQAIIFALVHLGNVAGAPQSERVAALGAALGAMPSIFLIAVFFALAYRKTGSLWFPIGFHAAWNFSLGCLFSLPVSGLKTFQLLDVQTQTQSWLSGGSFGAEGSFFLLPVLVALIWLINQTPDHPQALLDLELAQPSPIAPPTAATSPQSSKLTEAEESERENRYRTKFGTSEGFDSAMLLELRQLQQEREAAEAQARQQRATEQTRLETECLTPIVMVTQPVEPIEPLEIGKAVAAPEPVVMEPQIEMVSEMPRLEVEVVAVPVESPVEVSEEKAEAEAKPTAPMVPKKARPKW